MDYFIGWFCIICFTLFVRWCWIFDLLRCFFACCVCWFLICDLLIVGCFSSYSYCMVWVLLLSILLLVGSWFGFVLLLKFLVISFGWVFGCFVLCFKLLELIRVLFRFSLNFVLSLLVVFALICVFVCTICVGAWSFVVCCYVMLWFILNNSIVAVIGNLDVVLLTFYNLHWFDDC